MNKLILTQGDFTTLITLFLIFINLLGVFSVISDKKRAIKHKQRIPEKTLFILAIFGSSLAQFITMKIIRHKTQKLHFMLGYPLILIAQILITVYLRSAYVTN